MLPTKNILYKNTNTFKVKGWKKLYCTDIGQNEYAVTILISENVNFQAKKCSQG